MRNIRAVLKNRHINYTEARNVLEAHEDARELLEESVESWDPVGEPIENSAASLQPFDADPTPTSGIEPPRSNQASP